MTNENNNEERDIITLIDDEGKEIECEFIDTVEYESKLYCVVEPLANNSEYEEGSCYIFHLEDKGDDTVDLTPIESEEELNAVFQKFLENNAEEGCSGDCSSCSGCDSKD